MTETIKTILKRLEGAQHRGGAFASHVLMALADILPNGDLKTLETGAGKSTIVFSNLAAKHFVFAYDDRDAEGSSINLVLQDPDFVKDRTAFVFGPTQRTLPAYQFAEDDMFDVILLDGPHGYPFPDLEYALLYARLKPGGVLIIDDIHIPSIGNMYDLLREDRMYEEIGVFSTTGVLRRTSIAGVPDDGDHWFEQSYNFARFPLSMEKHRVDTGVSLGSRIDLAKPATLSRHKVKSFEAASQERAARTIDTGASLAFDIPGSGGGMLTINIEYKSIHADACRNARIVIGGQAFALPLSDAWRHFTATFISPASGRIVVTFLHPDAVTEEHRNALRYDFRRAGSYLRAVTFRALEARPAERDQASASADFVSVVADCAEQYPYILCPDLQESMPSAAIPLVKPVPAVQHVMQRKFTWSAAELLAFEGSDFADAVTTSLQDRPATDAERQALQGETSPSARLAFLTQIDCENRKAGRPSRVYGLDALRFLWRTERFFARRGLRTPAALALFLFRRAARSMQRELMPHIAQIQLAQTILHRIAASPHRD